MSSFDTSVTNATDMSPLDASIDDTTTTTTPFTLDDTTARLLLSLLVLLTACSACGRILLMCLQCHERANKVAAATKEYSKVATDQDPTSTEEMEEFMV